MTAPTISFPATLTSVVYFHLQFFAYPELLFQTSFVAASDFIISFSFQMFLAQVAFEHLGGQHRLIFGSRKRMES